MGKRVDLLGTLFLVSCQDPEWRTVNTMETYPTIPHLGGVRNNKWTRRYQDLSFICFDKADGSNIRAEWNPKRGFYKFGRRHGLLDDSNPFLLEAPELIKSKYGEDLDRIFREQRWQGAVAFFEFFGPNSFAGSHEKEPHEVLLIDLKIHRHGYIDPKDFVRLLGGLDIPTVCHRGQVTEEFQDQVSMGEILGLGQEGVVCKAMVGKKPIRFKIKRNSWYDRLRDTVKGDEALFDKLK